MEHNDKSEKAVAKYTKSNKDNKPTREFLKARESVVDLVSNLNKTQIVSKTSSTTTGQPGFYCELCDYLAKDSINFLDHINGIKHQKNMGMSMCIKRSTVEEVRLRFEYNIQKRQQAKKEYNIEERMRELEEEEERIKDKKREKRKGRKSKFQPLEDAPEDDLDDGLENMMGISGFGGSKRKC